MFTYTECKEFIENPKKLKSRITDYELTEHMLIELCMYIDQFIDDVDLRYERKLIELRGGQ